MIDNIYMLCRSVSSHGFPYKYVFWRPLLRELVFKVRDATDLSGRLFYIKATNFNFGTCRRIGEEAYRLHRSWYKSFLRCSFFTTHLFCVFSIDSCIRLVVHLLFVLAMLPHYSSSYFTILFIRELYLGCLICSIITNIVTTISLGFILIISSCYIDLVCELKTINICATYSTLH